MDEFKDVFPRGEENTAYSKYFVGQSYLNMLSVEQVVIGNVTFEPGCRNNWHIHHAKSGGGQILSGDFSISGESYKELKEDYLAFMITMVDILNGAAYLFDKKPDSDNRHWKERKKIQEYCDAIREDIASMSHTSVPTS